MRHAETIHDDLHARALVLENDGQMVALVVCDVIAVSSRYVQKARELIERATGIPAANVMVSPTHTHRGPATVDILATDEDHEYTDWLTGRIVDAVTIAAQKMVPARIGFGLTDEHRVTVNRRNRMKDGTVQMGRKNPENIVGPVGPIDPDVGVMYIEATDGTPLAALINFALHYVGTDSNSAISADYFGQVDAVLASIKGPDFVTMMLNGACGDINHGTEGSWAESKRVAEVIAGDALGVIGTMELRDHAELGAAIRPFTFERKRITEEDLAIAREYLEHGTISEKPFSWVRGQKLPPERYPMASKECFYLNEMPVELESEIQVLKVGQAAIVGLPGEIFTEIGLQIKKRSPFEITLISSLANDYIGYCATDKALSEGSYETWAGRWALPGAGIEARVVEGAAEALERIR